MNNEQLNAEPAPIKGAVTQEYIRKQVLAALEEVFEGAGHLNIHTEAAPYGLDVAPMRSMDGTVKIEIVLSLFALERRLHPPPPLPGPLKKWMLDWFGPADDDEEDEEGDAEDYSPYEYDDRW